MTNLSHIPPCGEPRNHAEEIANAIAAYKRDKALKEAMEREARIQFELEC